MGRDKALVPVEGVPMAGHAAAALEGAGCNPVLAVGGDAAALEALGLVTVPDGWPGEGPLGGVITALAACTYAEMVVVVACDTPWLRAATIRRLVAALDDHPEAVVAVASTDRVEPLCAAWRRSGAPAVVAAFHAGERRIHAVLATLPCLRVVVDAAELRNVNGPGDVPGDVPG